MNKFRAALVCFPFKSSVEENLLSVQDAVEDASEKGCELVCFPECALTGLPSDDYDYDIAHATRIPGETGNKLAELAATHGVFIAIGLLECEGANIYDTAVLFDNKGQIALKYRRINPQWRDRHAPEGLYLEGISIGTYATPFGNLAFLICGDMFDDNVVGMIKRENPDYVIVPLSRCFEDCGYDAQRWEREEKFAYARQVAEIGTTCLLVNALEPDGSFGGALVVKGNGEIAAESQTGEPSCLVYELSRML